MMRRRYGVIKLILFDGLAIAIMNGLFSYGPVYSTLHFLLMNDIF